MNRLPECIILLAMCWCAAIGSDIPSARPVDVAAFVRQLGSDDFAEREEATRQLLALNLEKPPPELLEASKSENPEVRGRANKVLTAIQRRNWDRLMRSGIASAKAGAIDRYIASSATWDIPAENERLWLPAFDLGHDLAKRGQRIWPVAASKGKGGTFTDYVKTFDPKFVRVNEPFRPEAVKDAWRIGVIAPGVEAPGAILDSIVISRGTVTSAESIRRSALFVNGNVILKSEITHCFIISDENMTAAREVQNVVIIARGDIKVAFAKDATLIAGGKVIFETPIPPNLDFGNVIKENIANPLGYITFFELSTVGVEAKSLDKVVQVTAVADGKPFATSGVKVGDVVTEVNGKKPDSPESLRRLLRDALAIGDATVKLQRGEKTETIKVTLPE